MQNKSKDLEQIIMFLQTLIVNSYVLSKVWFRCGTVDLRVSDITAINSSVKSWLYADLSIPQMLREYLQKQNHAPPPIDNSNGPSATKLPPQTASDTTQHYQDLLNASHTTIDDAVHDISGELN